MSASHALRAALAALLAASALSLPAGRASAGEVTKAEFAAIMDSTFGRGAWRMTGGYRTPERENQLRAQGAMTVRPGGLSRHSLGHWEAPGAFDLVVNGLSPYEAADRLRAAGAPFARYQPKGAHGTQGPHLHLEPYGFGASSAGVRMASYSAGKPQGPSRSATLSMPAPSAQRVAEIRKELALLQAGAEQDRAGAQLELGRAYVLGYVVPRDFVTAQSWLQAAMDNPNADPETRAEAEATLAQTTALLEATRAQDPVRFAQLSGTSGR